jgi:hypothetical protein
VKRKINELKIFKVWDQCSFFYFVINPSTAVLYGHPSTGHHRLYHSPWGTRWALLGRWAPSLAMPRAGRAVGVMERHFRPHNFGLVPGVHSH